MPPNKRIMSLYEKISLIMSSVALILSIVSVVAEQYSKSIDHPNVEFSTVDLHLTNGYQFKVIIENTGRRPARDILIQMRPFNYNFAEFLTNPEVIVDPLSPINVAVDVKNNFVQVKVERSLGPGDKLTVLVKGFIFSEIGGNGLVICKVYSDQGEARRVHSASFVDKSNFDF